MTLTGIKATTITFKKINENNINKSIKRKTICKAATVGVSECIGSASNKGITRDFTKGY